MTIMNRFFEFFGIDPLCLISGAAGLGCTTVNEAAIGPGQAFGVEFMITLVLVLVVFGAAADANNAPSVKVHKSGL